MKVVKVNSTHETKRENEIIKIKKCHNQRNMRKEINIERRNENKKRFHESFKKLDSKYSNEMEPFYTRNTFVEKNSFGADWTKKFGLIYYNL